MYKKYVNYIFTSLLVYASSASLVFSEDIKVPCIKADGGIGLRGLDKFDCKLVKGIVNDPKIKEDHEKKIIDKLAAQLANQAEQTIEEMALLDQYFSDNGGSLLLSKDVEDNCQLQVMSKPVCQQGFNQNNFNERMKILMTKFPSQKGSSLLELWSDKFSAVREPATRKGGQCPLTPSSGMFLLNAQLTEYDVKIFIDNLKGDRSSKHTSDSVNSAGDSFYYKYPQLKLLKTSESIGKEGFQFKKQFEDYARNYPGTGSYKEYLKQFFFNKTNRDPLASAVAHQCGQITKNMKRFLCEDLKSLAVPESDAATSFFTTEEEVSDLQVSKGFSCDQQIKEDGKDSEVTLQPGSAGAWSKQFTANTRVEASRLATSRSMNQFCSMYNCNDKLSKRLKSCEKGGPVTSDDLEQTFCKEGSLECSSSIQQAIAFLKPLELGKQHQQTAERILAGKATQEEIKAAENTPKRSAFFDNFVRTDGPSSSTSFVADKKLGVIPEERKYESSAVLEKKIEAGAQALAGKTETMKPERAQAPQHAIQEAPMQPRYDAFMANNNAQENENARRALINSHMKTSSKEAPIAARKMDTGLDSDRTEEMRKLRAELADAISGVKGTEEERLAAAADYNRSTLAPRSAASDPNKGLSQAERDRLDQYRENLNSWEGRLRNWQSQLTDREMRSFGSGGAPSTASADREDRARAAQDGFGSSSDSSGGLKLTKSGSSGGASAVGSKGEAGTERAPGADGVDSDVGIVNSENLATLKKDSLKNLGIVVDDTFVIRVRHKDKIYAIPVKTFSYRGKEMYVPILDDKNRELSKIVFDSPLFSDYRQYQAERDASVARR